MSSAVIDVVIGAGGKTGQECVRRLLSLGGDVRAVVRDLKTAPTFAEDTERLVVVQGDVTQPETLSALVSGARGIIFAASASAGGSVDAVDHKVGTYKSVWLAAAPGRSVKNFFLFPATFCRASPTLPQLLKNAGCNGSCWYLPPS
jgi:uncharacterized protein YbjT (DUF2867 family)